MTGARTIVGSAQLFAHLVALSDARGLFEHAEFTSPRPEHGYCVDDVARGLVVLSRDGAVRRQEDELRHLTEVYLAFVVAAQDAGGRIRNRCDIDGVWHGRHGVDDCWGRALWGLGSVAGLGADTDQARTALGHFERGATQRSPHRRAMIFAGLGAADVLRRDPGQPAATRLLADAARVAARPAPGHAPGPAWPWPEPRLTYANAALPEVLLAAGQALGEDGLTHTGLALLRWLLDTETREGQVSVAPVGGRGPGEHGPAFDQQPIEVAALADACATASRVTGDSSWDEAVRRCAGWFQGDNDLGVALLDEGSGGCCDGLEAGGRNENQGAESTLAMISTMLHARRLESALA